jgi:hypothetical protein
MRGKYRQSQLTAEACYRLTRALAQELKARPRTGEQIRLAMGEKPSRASHLRAEVGALKAWRSYEFTHDHLMLFCDAFGVDPFWAQACPWGPYGRLAS